MFLNSSVNNALIEEMLMTPSIKNYTITACSFLFLLLLSTHSESAFNSTDTLYLYEDGARIISSDVIMAHDQYKEKCSNGVCVLDQKFSRNLIFYKIPAENILSRYQWLEQSLAKDAACSGLLKNNATDMDAPEAQSCIKKYSVKNYTRYVEGFLKASEYASYITIPNVEDKSVHPLEGNILLTKIGGDRCLNVDLKTKSVEQVDCEEANAAQ